MKFRRNKDNSQSAPSAGMIHVRVEYEMDAKFIADLINTGFNTFARYTALDEGRPDPGPNPQPEAPNGKKESSS